MFLSKLFLDTQSCYFSCVRDTVNAAKNIYSAAILVKINLKK